MKKKLYKIIKQTSSGALEKASAFRKSRYFLRTILCIVILVIGIFSFITLSSITHKPKEKSPEDLIKTLITVPVKVKDYRYEFTGYGSVKPSQEITIFAEAQGHVNYISPKLEEGLFVEKNDVLIRIEDIDYQLSLKEAETELVSYSTKIKMKEQDIKDGEEMLDTQNRRMEFDKTDYLRKQNLANKKAISVYTLEEAGKKYEDSRNQYINQKSKIAKDKLELKSLKSDLARALVQKKQAEINLKRSTIKAPIDGRVENVQIETDEYVSKGTPLFEINNYNELTIPVSVDIEDASYIFNYSKPNNNKSLSSWFRLIKGISVMIKWTGNPNFCSWEGKILRIEKVNPETRTLTIAVTPIKYIGDHSRAIPLVEGMFCKVEFKGKTIPDTIKIPWAALQINRKILVVKKDNTVYETDPEIINSNKNNLVISAKNLNKDESIVAQRVPADVVNGSKVRAIPLNSNL